MTGKTPIPRLTLHLRGPFRASGLDGDITGLSRRGQAMLAFLSQQSGMRAERGLLADLLWSDRSEEQARASLRQELSVLKKSFADEVIEANRQLVWLAPSLVTVDTSERGEFLQGFDLPSEGFEDWLRDARASAPGKYTNPENRPMRTRPSLAVLPFEELGVTECDMFVDGIVEEITGALSRVHEFHVIARQSAYALQGERIDVPEAAKRLGVEYVVEGTVRRAGNRVRISIQLVDGANGRTLWSDRFDDQIDDVFDLQDRIAAQVAGQLSTNLRSAEIEMARTHAPTDRTAYELVLSAMPLFWTHDRDDNAKAIALFDAALSRDPEYALALAMKAWGLAQQTVYLWTDKPAPVRKSAEKLAGQAVVGAGDHVLTLVAIGAAISMCSNETDRAKSFLDHALAIDPNCAWGWMRMGFLHVYSDRPEEARTAFDRAISLSPLDPFMHNMVLGQGMAEFRSGNYEAARQLVEQGMKIGPGVQWALRPLISIYQALGREEDAMRAAEEFKKAHPGITLRLILDSLPPTFTTTFPIYFDGLRKAGVPEE